MKLNATARWLIGLILVAVLAFLTVMYVQSGGGLAILLAIVPLLIAAAGVWGLYQGRTRAGWTAVAGAALPYLILLAVIAGTCDSGFCLFAVVGPGGLLWLVGLIAAIYCIIPSEMFDARIRRRAALKRTIAARERARRAKPPR